MLLSFAAVLVFEKDVLAQDALRASLAGQYAMEVKKRQISSGWGDVHLGPLQMDLQAQLAVVASDNVRYREEGRQEDLIFRPGVTIRTLWPVTEKNRLTFGAGLGYNKYVSNGDLDYFYLSPDSSVGFDFYVGDFVINIHDRFQFSRDVASQPSVSGRGSYGRFNNSAGVLTTWDLNKMVVLLNYDHVNYLATESDLSYLNRSSELVGLRTALLVTPVTPVGVELGFGTTDYDQDVLNDLVHYSFGAFYEAPAGRFSTLRLAGGYVIYEPTSQVNTNFSGSSMNAVYAELAWSHQITRHILYSISAGQQLQTGVYSETLKLLYARLTVRWSILRGYGLSSTFGYENGKEGWISTVEHFERYAVGLGINKRLNQNLSTGAGYNFYYRSSDVKGRNYTQNQLVLNLSYSF